VAPVTRWRFIARGLAVIPIVFFVAREARADSAAEAEALFHDGTQLLEAGRFAEACLKLAGSQKLDPALGTLLYLAACHQKLGLTATAWTEFSSATEWAERTDQPKRTAFGRTHMIQLESTLAKVVIRAVRVLPQFEVKVDDEVLDSPASGAARPLDPGTHTVEATAPGFVAWRTTVHLAARAETLTVDVPALEPALPPAAPQRAMDPSPPRDGATSSATLPSQVLASSAAGLATAGIVVGSVFGVMTFAARNSARAACPQNACGPGGLDDVDRLRTYATVSTVAFGVGLAAALATGYFNLRGNASRGGPGALARSVTLVPGISPRQAGIELLARFR